MKKNLLFSIAALLFLQCKAQLIVQLQVPQAGLFEKTQLWSMVLTNTANVDQNISIKLNFIDAGTGQPVMSATTQPITLQPGLKYVSAHQLGVIQYNNLSNVFLIDASPYGLLPVGSFKACYSFFTQGSETDAKVFEQCQDIVVNPLSPPQLLYPYEKSSLVETTPVFSWMPPAPINMFTKVSYDLNLVEVLPGQTPVDAIGQNVPLYMQRNLPATSISYPGTAPALQKEKLYAWRIVAKSLQASIGESEVWQFTLKQQEKNDSVLRDAGLPYVKLKKEGETGYALFVGELKFDYLNETADTAWNVVVHDLSTPLRKKMAVDLSNVPLEPGQNLISYPLEERAGFIDQHQYSLEITNSRGEIWRMRFQYRKRPEG